MGVLEKGNVCAHATKFTQELQTLLRDIKALGILRRESAGDIVGLKFDIARGTRIREARLCHRWK